VDQPDAPSPGWRGLSGRLGKFTSAAAFALLVGATLVGAPNQASADQLVVRYTTVCNAWGNCVPVKQVFVVPDRPVVVYTPGPYAYPYPYPYPYPARAPVCGQRAVEGAIIAGANGGNPVAGAIVGQIADAVAGCR
jgi:hypothetical protein